MLNNGTLGSIAFYFQTLFHRLGPNRPSSSSRRRYGGVRRRGFCLSRRFIFFILFVGILFFIVSSPRYYLILSGNQAPQHLQRSSIIQQLPNACPARPPGAHLNAFKTGFSWRTDLPTEKHLPLTPEPLPILSSTLAGLLPHVQSDKFPHATKSSERIRRARLATIKEVFLRGWHSYREYAWLQDELMPISAHGKDSQMFGYGMAATLVDNLDTLLIMDLKEEFDLAVTAVMDNIHFGPPPEESVVMSTFEVTIRQLGGLISTYDLGGCTDGRVLDKAVALGDMLMRSFDNPTLMPVTRWDLKRAAAFAKGDESQIQPAADNAILAEFASFGPEFTRLSQLTGDDRYYDVVARVAREMREQQNSTQIPGMWPIGLNARIPDMKYDNKFGIGAMADSAYEYLIKMFAILGGSSEGEFGEMYAGFVDAAVDAGMFFRPVAPGAPDVLFPGNLVASGVSVGGKKGDPTLDPVGAHLACFAGGMLMLGGRLLDRLHDVDLGLKTAEGCAWAYEASAFGIMPERFHLKPCDEAYLKLNSDSCDLNQTIWDEEFAGRGSSHVVKPPGFVRIDEKGYSLRPEAIESIFYAYRVTGDNKYREIAWKMFTSIEKYTATSFGNAAVVDVTVADTSDAKKGSTGTVDVNGPLLSDSMESFWMAETLKYFYLIFSEPEFLSLDEWVFNTEAHPFRRPAARAVNLTVDENEVSF